MEKSDNLQASSSHLPERPKEEREPKAGIEKSEESRRLYLKCMPFLSLFLVIILCAYTVGVHDYGAAAVWICCFGLIFLSVYRGKLALREVTKLYFAEDTPLYKFFSNKKSIFPLAASLFMSLIISIIFIGIVKISSSVYGFWYFISFVSLSFLFVNSLSVSTKSADITNNNISQNIPRVAEFIPLISTAISFNFTLCIFFLIKDIYVFFSESVYLNNFVVYAEARSILKNDYNSFSRAIVNYFLVLDAFRLALVNEISVVFDIDSEDMEKHFFVFATFIFIINFLKFLTFSIGLYFIYSSINIIARSERALLVYSGTSSFFASMISHFATFLSFLMDKYKQKIINLRNK